MIWEVQKGRACDTALNFALQTIEAKNVLIDGQGKIIELRGSQIAQYQKLDTTWSLRLDNANDLFHLEKSDLKMKLRKRNKIIFGQSVSIVVLIAILLLG